ncbi:MAG: dethiobiotin synthase [Anaerovoracaceae bacterium]
MRDSYFVIGTGTDVGKTYVTKLILKSLKDKYKSVGYYKAALSGFTKGESDLDIAIDVLGEEFTKVSYIYINPFSPHLAAKVENNLPELKKIKNDYEEFAKNLDAVVSEGSGGIICPIRDDKDEEIMLEDIIKITNGKVILVTNSGLGAINGTALTAHYCKSKGINIYGIVMNFFDEKNIIHVDNRMQIEKLTGIKVLATIPRNGFSFIAI